MTRRYKDIIKQGASDGDYGVAILKRLSNKTGFNLFLNKSNNNLDIPDNSVVRLSVKSDGLKMGNRYYLSCFENPDTKLLSAIADDVDPEDESTMMIVKNINRDGRKYLGFYPKKYPGNCLQANEDGKDSTLAFFGKDDFALENGATCHWFLDGTLSKGFLKHRASEAYLGPDTKIVTNKKSFDGEQRLRFKNEVISDSKNSESFSSLYFNIATTIKNLVENKEDSKLVDELKNHLAWKQNLYSKIDQVENIDSCCFVDCVRIRNVATGFILACKDGELVLRDNSGEPLDEEWFLIKGPYSFYDKLNCTPGQNVAQSDGIRLQSLSSQQNISISDNNFLPSELMSLSDLSNSFGTIKQDFTGKDSRFFKVKLSDKKSESSDDDFIVVLQSESSLALGSVFGLQSLSKFCNLESLPIFSTKSGLCYQQVVAKKILNQQSSAKDISSNIQSSSDKINKDAAGFDLWIIDAVKKINLQNKNYQMRIGYADNGAFFDKVGLEVENNQEIEIQVVEKREENFIKPKTDEWVNEILCEDPMIVDGASVQKLTNVQPGTSLEISALHNQGIAWISQAVSDFSNFSFKFLVKIDQQDEVCVVLGDQASTSFYYKLYLPLATDKSYRLVKLVYENGLQVEQEVLKNSLQAGINNYFAFGTYLPFWLSFDGKNIICGASEEIGDNIGFCLSLDEEPKIDRIGFSCNKKDLSIVFDKMLPAIKLENTQAAYVTEPLDLSPDVVFFKNVIRQPGRGCFVFDYSKLLKSKIYFTSDQKIDSEGYLVSVADPDPESISVSKMLDGKVTLLMKFSSGLLKKQNNIFSKFWIVIDQSNFIFGLGEVGENYLGCFYDQNPVPTRFVAAQSNNEISLALNFFPLENFTFLDSTNDFNKTPSAQFFARNMDLVLPFKYKLYQEKEGLYIKDFLTNKTTLLSRMPTKGTKYYLMLQINPDGAPMARWVWQPENEVLANLAKQEQFFRIAGQNLQMASGRIQGSAMMDMVGTTASIAFASMSLPLSFKAAELKAQMDSMQSLEKANQDFLQSKKGQEDFGVASQSTTLSAKVGTQSVKDRDVFLSRLKILALRLPSTQDELFKITSQAKELVILLKNQFVLSDSKNRKTLLDKISSLYPAANQFFENFSKAPLSYAQDCIELFTLTANNQVLCDVKDPELSKQRDKFLSWANLIFRSILKNNPKKPVILQPNFGEFFWLENKAKKPGVIDMSFQIKGNGAFVIAFANNSFKLSSQNKVDYYEIGLTDFKNKPCYVSLGSFSEPIAKSQSKNFMMSMLDFKTYNLKVENGLITLSVLGKANKIIETWSYQDPYPSITEKFVGIGSMTGLVTLQNLVIKP